MLNTVATLGYRINPFSHLDVEEWQSIAILTPHLLDLLQTKWRYIQLLGPKGYGKTTHLLKLTHILNEQGQTAVYEYLPPGQHHFTLDLADPTLSVALLDEAQRLWPWEKMRLMRRLAQRHASLRLICSSHRSYHMFFRWFRLPLDTIAFDHLESATLQHILEQRLAYFANDPQQPAPIVFTRSACDKLIELFGGDVRAMEAFLYELLARLDAPRALTAEHIESMASTLRRTGYTGLRRKGYATLSLWRKAPRSTSSTNSQPIEM